MLDRRRAHSPLTFVIDQIRLILATVQDHQPIFLGLGAGKIHRIAAVGLIFCETSLSKKLSRAARDNHAVCRRTARAACATRAARRVDGECIHVQVLGAAIAVKRFAVSWIGGAWRKGCTRLVLQGSSVVFYWWLYGRRICSSPQQSRLPSAQQYKGGTWSMRTGPPGSQRSLAVRTQ